MSEQDPGATRRDFLKGAAAASAATLLTSLPGSVHADGSDVIRVGLRFFLHATPHFLYCCMQKETKNLGYSSFFS